MPLRFPVQVQPSSAGRPPVKREAETTMQETGLEPFAAATAEDAADDEDEYMPPPDDRGAFDSGIGTSMESEHVASGLARRRSGRSLREKE